MTVVFMFPSPASLYAGAIHRLLQFQPQARVLLEEASDVLGRDLVRHYDTAAPKAFRTRIDRRFGVFLANAMYQKVLEEAGVRSDLSIGFCQGEYNHVVHIGAVDFPQALELLQQQGVPGLPVPVAVKAVVRRIKLDQLEELVERAKEHGTVEIAGMFSPHSHLLIGEPEVARWVFERLEEEAPQARVMRLSSTVPFHSSMLREQGRWYAEFLETFPFREPSLPYFPNVLGRPVEEPSPGTFAEMLSRHVYQPVRWRQAVDYVVEHYPDPVFVEVGPNSLLCSFLRREKRWHPEARWHACDSLEEASSRHLEKVIEDLAA